MTYHGQSIPSVIPFYRVNCPVMAYMIWNYVVLMIIYFFASKSFSFMVCFLDQILLTLDFLKKYPWIPPFSHIFFFNDMHSCNINTYADDTVIFTSSSDIDAIQSRLSQDWFSCLFLTSGEERRI